MVQSVHVNACNLEHCALHVLHRHAFFDFLHVGPPYKFEGVIIE